MRLLTRVKRHVAVEQLPVLRIAVDVETRASRPVKNGAASFAASTDVLNFAENLGPYGNPEVRFYRLQSVPLRIGLHRQELLEVGAFVSDAAFPRRIACRD